MIQMSFRGSGTFYVFFAFLTSVSKKKTKKNAMLVSVSGENVDWQSSDQVRRARSKELENETQSGK